MNVNTNEATREDLTILGEELTASSGVRAVSAWLSMWCPPEVPPYDLDDEEAPYEFRSAVTSEIGDEAALEGLDPSSDIPRYLVYMRLCAAYGTDWLIEALSDYLRDVKGIGDADAATIWEPAVERYGEVRILLLQRELDQGSNEPTFGDVSMSTDNFDGDCNSLIPFGDEMTTSSGVRAVAAWLALCEPEVVSYALDDEEAPYELRGMVATDIGWGSAWEGLDPERDVPRYRDYMDLHSVYGSEWPHPALTAYLEQHREMTLEDAEEAAHAIWQAAMERYEEVRNSIPRDGLDKLAA